MSNHPLRTWAAQKRCSNGQGTSEINHYLPAWKICEQRHNQQILPSLTIAQYSRQHSASSCLHGSWQRSICMHPRGSCTDFLWKCCGWTFVETDSTFAFNLRSSEECTYMSTYIKIGTIRTTMLQRWACSDVAAAFQESLQFSDGDGHQDQERQSSGLNVAVNIFGKTAITLRKLFNQKGLGRIICIKKKVFILLLYHFFCC